MTGYLRVRVRVMVRVRVRVTVVVLCGVGGAQEGTIDDESAPAGEVQGAAHELFSCLQKDLEPAVRIAGALFDRPLDGCGVVGLPISPR